MKKEKENPTGFEPFDENDPIYLLARYKAYCDAFCDENAEQNEKTEGIGEEEK